MTKKTLSQNQLGQGLIELKEAFFMMYAVHEYSFCSEDIRRQSIQNVIEVMESLLEMERMS